MMTDPAATSSIGELLVQWLPLVTSATPAVADLAARVLNEATGVAVVDGTLGAGKRLAALRQRLLEYATEAKKPPENHDLQRAVYVSFLGATEVIFQTRLIQLGQKIDLSWFEGLRRDLLSRLPSTAPVTLGLNEPEIQGLNRRLEELRQEQAISETLSVADLQSRMPFGIDVIVLRDLIGQKPIGDTLLAAILVHSPWYRHSGDSIAALARENLWAYMARFFAEEVKSQDRVAKILNAQMLADTGVSIEELKSELGQVATSLKELREVIKSQTDSFSDMAPSFEELTLPVEPCAMADRFLDAIPPTLSDIASEFDIRRTVFCGRDGLQESVRECLTRNSGSLLISMSGPSGGGKSVLAMRLAYDCLREGFKVFKLLPDWECSDAIGIQIRRILDSFGRPALFVLDGAAGLIRKGIRPVDIFRTAKGVKTSCALLFIENWRLFRPTEFGNSALNVGEAKHFSVLPLTTTELGALVDRIMELETGGRVKEVRCHFSKEKRLALCSEDRDRLVVAALLILRYGRRVADILAHEFSAIRSDAVRDAYISTVLCSGLGLSVPKAIITKVLRSRGVLQPLDFWKQFLEIIADSNGAVSLRHPRFYQYLAPIVIPEPHDRADLLTELLSHADVNANEERNFVLDIFSYHKRISNLLLRDKTSIEHWIADVHRHLSIMPAVCRRTGYVCLAQLERDSLHDFGKADEFFGAAISCDPTFAFAYRQRSWNLLRAGRLTEAEKSADEAADTFPDDAKTLSDSACVLQYCGPEGFRRASRLFGEALKIELEDTDLRKEVLKRVERHQEASGVLQYYVLEGNDLPDQVLEELKAPWYLWRLRKGVRRALKAQLGSLLRDVEVDPDDVEDVIHNAGGARDDVLDALIRANAARLEYQQWYHAGKQIDVDTVEGLFVKALHTLGARHGESEPFVRTWYGTFLKEVRQDFVAAEREYRLAIDQAQKLSGRNNDYPLRNEPMLLNNLALLLMHAARTRTLNKRVLEEAESLLNTAIDEMVKRQSKFLWPLESAEELKLLKGEFHQESSGETHRL
jgi:tetratricopeptide (TPR) repeat protein